MVSSSWLYNAGKRPAAFHQPDSWSVPEGLKHAGEAGPTVAGLKTVMLTSKRTAELCQAPQLSQGSIRQENGSRCLRPGQLAITASNLILGTVERLAPPLALEFTNISTQLGPADLTTYSNPPSMGNMPKANQYQTNKRSFSIKRNTVFIDQHVG